jgi:hypothetical protein
MCHAKDEIDTLCFVVVVVVGFLLLLNIRHKQ